MLEYYFLKPQTIDTIRNSWLGEIIERYVIWLHENNYARTNIYRRVPLLKSFGNFASKHGA
jgi:integrase/recombinase XerD